MIAGAVVWLQGSLTARPRVMATLQGFTNGTPNWSVDSYFIRMSPQRARMMQEWFAAGTNAAQFSIKNAAHAVSVAQAAEAARSA